MVEHVKQKWFTALIVLLAPVTLGMAQPAQAIGPATPASDLSRRLAAIEAAMEDKRKAAAIPGMALVVVSGDDVLLMKGFGLRDVEANKPVTPDTVFPIGSATKSFTAMAAAIAQDDGRLTLDDSPKKYLPFFRMRDPAMDAEVTLRDLLSHRSGLARADMAFSSGKLSRDEVIQVDSFAKAAAPLRQTFQYNNVMVAAAGAAIGRAEHTTWDRFVADHIFGPLDMVSSSTGVSGRLGARDFAYGYEPDPQSKQPLRMAAADLDVIAPAGAINSTARDMANWLRFMIAGGVWNGKRIVSEARFRELITSQIEIFPGYSYGLGWYLDNWKGHKLVSHAGNIAGFHSYVSFLPDERVGFVLLTNVDGAAISEDDASDIVYSNLVPAPGSNASAIAAAPRPSAGTSPASGQAYSDLLGTYQSALGRGPIEIALRDGKLTWVNAQKVPLAMTAVSQDSFTIPAVRGLTIKAVRNAQGGINRVLVSQPAGDVEYDRVGSFVAPFTAAELMRRVVAAMGGEAELRQHRSMIRHVSINYETQGIEGEMTILNRAPDSASDHIVLKALHRPIGTIDEYFDGRGGGGRASFGTHPSEELAGTALNDERITDHFYGLLDWQSLFSNVEIRQATKLEQEPVYIVVATPAKGTPIAYWISARSYLVLRKDVLSFPRTLTVLLDDYRRVGGEMIPFRETRIHRFGIADSEVLRTKDVRFDVDIPDSAFQFSSVARPS